MDKRRIDFAAVGQEITFSVVDPVPRGDTQQYLTAHFSVDGTWEGLALQAVFGRKGRGFSPVTVSLDETMACDFPPSLLTAPEGGGTVYIRVGLIGTDTKGERLTTGCAAVPIAPSCYVRGETPKDPPQDVYTKLLRGIGAKLDANQGAANAGKVLGIGEDGGVVPVEAPSGGGGVARETDPTVPAWAKQPQKPSYTADEVGALSGDQLGGAVNAALAEAKTSGMFDGENGHTPVKGEDYFTEEDKAEWTGYIADELAKRGQLRPEFANDTAECTDTAKLYVLPDGYIYGYMKKTQAVYHNANDGTGFLNVRPTASAGTTTEANTTKNGLFSTAAISLDRTKSRKITISGLEKLVPTFYATIYVYFFDANGNYLKYTSNKELGITAEHEVDITLPVTFDAFAGLEVSVQNQVAFIRICLGIHKTNSITDADVASLVVNVEQHNGVQTAYGWHSTGHMFNTDDYGQAIERNAGNIAVLQEEVEALRKAVKTAPSQSGAVWYAVGDSITRGYGVGAENGWVAHVLRYNGYDAERSKNLGISGLGFAKADPNYGKTARTVVDETSFAEADLVTVAVGINDWKEPFSLDTIKSEMRYCLEKILADNPYCKIILIAPFNMRNKGSADTNWALGYSGSDVTGGTLQSFIDAQKSVCAEYGVQVIDMTNDSVINRQNIGTVLYDGIHPDAACHRALGRELARRIAFA